MGNKSRYEADFYGWALEEAQLLRAGRLAEVDVENIAEEIESMGRSQKRELVSRLAVLLLRLLKWQFQSHLRSRSWQVTISRQREQIAGHLAANPSLQPSIPDVMPMAYKRAKREAEAETGLPGDAFPWSCPYTFEQTLDEAFWPET